MQKTSSSLCCNHTRLCIIEERHTQSRCAFLRPYTALRSSKHKPEYKPDHAQAHGTESAVEEVAEIVFVDGVARLVGDEEAYAGYDEDIEQPADDFDEKIHNGIVFCVRNSFFQ